MCNMWLVWEINVDLLRQLVLFIRTAFYCTIFTCDFLYMLAGDNNNLCSSLAFGLLADTADEIGYKLLKMMSYID